MRGKGERLLPLTKSLPKPLIKINKKEILSYVIDDLVKFKFYRMIILTGYKYQLIENFIKNIKRIKISVLFYRYK